MRKIQCKSLETLNNLKYCMHGAGDAVVSETTSERSLESTDINGLSSPAPSPAPPQPTVTLENASNLPADDSADVQRFVDAASSSPDEKLGSGVELLKAPLIAAFALQQEEATGKTRNLFAYPLASPVSEQLLRNERLTLSVAGQVTKITPKSHFSEQTCQKIHSFLD